MKISLKATNERKQNTIKMTKKQFQKRIFQFR
jgi:hypothetical protein